jgi:hypothetical protein
LPSRRTFKIDPYKKDPKHLPGLGHPAVLYKINTDKKDPKRLPGLGHPAVISQLLLMK